MKKNSKETYNLDAVYDELIRRSSTDLLEFIISKGEDCKLTWDELIKEYNAPRTTINNSVGNK